ncbi:MAG: DNA polymerase III subunit alpha, partial [Acidobacteriota bacterium]
MVPEKGSTSFSRELVYYLVTVAHRMANDFTHLHVHSHYSLLDGLGKVDDLVSAVKEMGMNSIALTDHGSMYGTIEFVETARQHNIKPIIGMEAYLAPHGHTRKRGKIDSNPRHLTLLAQNTVGYKHLMKLSTEAFLHGFYYKPRIDYELLERYGEGLIVLSGCMNSDISRAVLERRRPDAEKLIEWHRNVFGSDHFYLEIQHHPHIPEQGRLNEAIIGYAKKYNLGLVATADTHYIKPEDAEAQDVLICVQTGKKVSDKDRLTMLEEDFSLTRPREVKEAWKQYPEAVDNTQKIAEMCNVEIEFGVNKLPRYPLPAGKSPDAALRELCFTGLVARYGAQMPKEAQARLSFELEVIKKTGYASYFLIVQDFVNEAKKRGILVGPGRGSAAGSLVAYLTNITNVDPLAYNLLFERFLNPERVSMPDIDLDFADDRRMEVIDYVREKYGHEHVAQIITFGTMAARAAVRDAGRALDFPYAFCDAVAKAIPPLTTFAEALSAEGELKHMYAVDPQAKKLIDTARKLEGVCRHASTHAAAVVITDKPLTEYVPLQLTSTGDGDHDTVTQYA